MSAVGERTGGLRAVAAVLWGPQVDHAGRIRALADHGVSEPILDAYAQKLRISATGQADRRGEAADDLIFLAAFYADRDVVANLPMATLAGYAFAEPGITPATEDIYSRMRAWGFRPIGWLAFAAGLTPDEYNTRHPDVQTLVLLAGLRHGPAIGLLAEALA